MVEMGRINVVNLIQITFYIVFATVVVIEASIHAKDIFFPFPVSEEIWDLVYAISTVWNWNPGEVQISSVDSEKINFSKSSSDKLASQAQYRSLMLNRQEVLLAPLCLAELHNPDSTMDILGSDAPQAGMVKSESVSMRCESSWFVKDEQFGRLEVLDVKRTLVGNGAHRQLNSFVTLELQIVKNKGICHIVMLEKLPQGVFADTFELQRLVDRGVLQNARVFGDLNIELPAFNSHPSLVVLHISVNTNSSYQVESKWRLQKNIVLPLHARYPPLNFKTHGLVTIGLPSLLFQFCKENTMTKGLCSDDSELMKNDVWRHVVWRENMLTKLIELEWLIPSGNPCHTKFVTIVTVLTALMAAVVLFMLSYYFLGT
eukprot:c20478_g1_i1 orf=510-1628(+)